MGPDKNPEHVAAAEKQFHRITEAFETLKDPARKTSYDGRLLCELKRRAKHERRQPPSPPPPDFEFYNWDKRITRRRRKKRPDTPPGSPNSAEERMREIPRERKRRKRRRFKVVPENGQYNESFNFTRQ